MRTRLGFIILAVSLFAAGSATAGSEEPIVSVHANAPGWITVRWDHSGVDVFWYELHRQDSPGSVARLYGASGTLTDTNLQPSTWYSYKICAIYDYNSVCSGWRSAKTLQSELPQPPAAKPVTPSQPSPPPLMTPQITATTNHPLIIRLHWGSEQAWLLTNVQLYRNGRVVYDGRNYGDFIASYPDHSLRANTEYTYKVCFIRFDETKCSNEIKAMGQPITPTAPESLTIKAQRIMHANRSRTMAPLNLTTTIYADAAWQNSAIPGQFITIERQDTSWSGRGGVRTTTPVTTLTPYWREVMRISSVGDPAGLLFDVDVPAAAGSLKGTTYRVCAVVPQLGDLGVACSASVPLH